MSTVVKSEIATSDTDDSTVEYLGEEPATVKQESEDCIIVPVSEALPNITTPSKTTSAPSAKPKSGQKVNKNKAETREQIHKDFQKVSLNLGKNLVL